MQKQISKAKKYDILFKKRATHFSSAFPGLSRTPQKFWECGGGGEVVVILGERRWRGGKPWQSACWMI